MLISTLVPAIFLFYGILSLAYAGVLFQFTHNRKDPAVTYWSLGACFMGIATICTIFRSESTLSIVYISTNGIAAMAHALFALGIRQLLDQTFRLKPKAFIFIASLIAYCSALIFIGLYAGPLYQTVFVSTVVCVIYLYAGYLAFTLYQKTRNNHARILATASFLNVVLWLVRSIFATYGLSINAFNPNTFNSIIFICIFLVGIFWYFTFIALLYSRATQAEQAALTRFEGMATTLPCALYEYFLHPDYTSEFRYVSPSIKELVGHSAESVMENASLIIDQVHPDDQEYFWKVNLESYNTGKTFFIETRLIVLDGSTKWVQLSSSPRGEDFKNVTWSGYIIDITERKQFQEKANTVDLLTNKNQEISTLLKEKEQLVVSLLKANKTAVTGALSASIAHELNQPIGASNLNIQFLQKKFDQNELSPALGKQVLSLLARDNHRAANIIRSLQSMFLQDEVIKETCQFDVVLESVLSLVRSETNKNGISINIDMPSHVNILINEVDMKQILLNLLNNAIRELSNIEVIQKEILIECTQTLNLTTISISDSGRGISPDRQRNLFELLSHEKNIGMGIGLWLCKYIATRYSGQLHHEVSKMGGAKFTITIPS